MLDYKPVNKEAWKLDDPEWVKQRQKEWRDYEFNLSNHGIFNEKKDYVHYKEYFLTGNEKAFEKVSNASYSDTYKFIALWFHADDSLETCKNIANQMESLVGFRMFFRSFYRPFKFKGLSYYNGKDLNMYRVLFPDYINKSYKNYKDHDDFIRDAFGIYVSYTGYFKCFIKDKKVNPYDFCQLTIPFWNSAISLAYKKHKAVSGLIKEIKKFKEKNIEPKDERHQLVEKLEAVFESDDIPQAMKDDIQEFKAGLK